MKMLWSNRGTTLIILMVLLTLPLISPHLFAQQDATALQTDIGDLEVGGGWIYGDLEKGIEIATDNGKPLFVLFR
jgi:hypothetical protein